MVLKEEEADLLVRKLEALGFNNLAELVKAWIAGEVTVRRTGKNNELTSKRLEEWFLGEKLTSKELTSKAGIT
mgnify:CR=1 FL=1